MLIPVILSGGAGTRLWPASRQAYPKPFMRLGDGESLLLKTLQRALRCADAGEIVTVTSQDHYFITRDEYARVASAARHRTRILSLPSGRHRALRRLCISAYARHLPGVRHSAAQHLFHHLLP